MVPNSSCRQLADFDDDTLAKTWLHDEYNPDEVFGKDTQSFIGMPVSPVTPKKVVSGHSLRA